MMGTDDGGWRPVRRYGVEREMVRPCMCFHSEPTHLHTSTATGQMNMAWYAVTAGSTARGSQCGQQAVLIMN
jgi:hypothetical protein